MTSYLIVASYDHQSYSHFRDNDDPKRLAAREKAYELFSTNGADLAAYFTFVDAFQYLDVPAAVAEADGSEQVTVEGSVAPELRERILSNQPYGWVGIVPDDQAFSMLREAMGWPDSPFCSVFDIQIIPLQGNDPVPRQEEDALTWQERGQKIYDHQTPAMWR